MARRTQKIAASVVITVAASDLACQGPPVPVEVIVDVPPLPSVSASASAAPALAAPSGDQVSTLLAPYALTDTSPARRVLYTWTTREQIDELAKDRVLLTRSVSPTHGPAYFDRVVADLATRKDPIAELLRKPAFAKSRFAWHAPWATLLGWPGESYGDELIQVTLKREALLLVLNERETQGTGPHFTAFDMDNNPVGLDEVKSHPERVAAVYFTHDPDPNSPGCGTYSTYAGRAYREFVIVNEAMVERWEARAPAMAQELVAEAAALDAAAQLFTTSPPPLEPFWDCRLKVDAWRGRGPKSALFHYEASLAFGSDLYLPKGPSLHKLASDLRAIAAKMSAPIGHTPTAVFPMASASAPPRPPPPPSPKGTKKKRWGTF